MSSAGTVTGNGRSTVAGRRWDNGDEAILLPAAFDPESIPVGPDAGEPSDAQFQLA